jgi:hypothetical protein
MRKIIALLVVALWAVMVSISFADSLEDAHEEPNPTDQVTDQAIACALATPRVKPTSVLSRIRKSRRTFNPICCSGFDVARLIQLTALRVVKPTLCVLLLAYRLRLFQFLCVYRL